jgi:hypothetical protein
VSKRTVTKSKAAPPPWKYQTHFSGQLMTPDGKWLADPEDEKGELFKRACQKSYLQSGWEQDVRFG